ncbi:hypothetical protein FTUN_2018 [Frigoriglobus tundricola]|uniref:Uncharacterized protein n=1 Tax=Frigoriglobus tundricola TaxID=2774151 RepID=A0A6M5YKE2_9BACT|nr:hypothetical protein FTUN_2018 [Frigoriglobus tundricola]
MNEPYKSITLLKVTSYRRDGVSGVCRDRPGKMGIRGE